MFNAKKEVTNIVKFIQDYYEKNNLKGAVLGISGGKDSAAVAALFVKALGKENVIGLALPIHSKEEDELDAKLISDFYGFQLVKIDLTKTYDEFKKNFLVDEKFLGDSDINLKPRLRMAAMYYSAAMYTKLYNKPFIVAGTANKSESYVGYFTKGGDSVRDIEVLANLTVSEVIKLGEVLKVPKKVLYKTPSDGLSGLSDEEKLQITYQEIDDYLNNLPISKKSAELIEKYHQNNAHKFKIPTYTKKCE